MLNISCPRRVHSCQASLIGHQEYLITGTPKPFIISLKLQKSLGWTYILVEWTCILTVSSSPSSYISTQNLADQDLVYVAAVWNTYRTTLLQLCDVITQCGQYLETDTVRFRNTDEYQMLHLIARNTAEAICSSVAYHINNDWVNHITSTNLHPSPKALGGLLLILPLYGGSILSIVPNVNRAWMRRRLRAIGVSMGLAQATVLADTVDLWKTTDPFKPLIIAQGHVFMWSASMF